MNFDHDDIDLMRTNAKTLQRENAALRHNETSRIAEHIFGEIMARLISKPDYQLWSYEGYKQIANTAFQMADAIMEVRCGRIA